MAGAVLALMLGGLSIALGLSVPIPIFLPIIGLALGFNAILKERKKEQRQTAVVVLAILALVTNGFVSTMFVLGNFVK
jgi:hypothetical protein